MERILRGQSNGNKIKIQPSKHYSLQQNVQLRKNSSQPTYFRKEPERQQQQSGQVSQLRQISHTNQQLSNQSSGLQLDKQRLHSIPKKLYHQIAQKEVNANPLNPVNPSSLKVVQPNQKQEPLSFLDNLAKNTYTIKSISQHYSYVQIPQNLFNNQKFNSKGNLLNIKKIIAVSSCKGGVGKSTIAVNLAASLKKQGLKVGIFDSNIYSPSLPTLINIQGLSLRFEPNQEKIEPINYKGMICMSFGFVGRKSVVMREPIASSIVLQLMHQTNWGQLDYLVVDMPPGTGEIQLKLYQQLKFDGAVIVTTPQRLSFVDAIKSIEVFQYLGVKILGIVENKSYYFCKKCGKDDLINSKGQYNTLIKEKYGIKNFVNIPLLGEISKCSDNGTPIVFFFPRHFICQIYSNLCNLIKKQLEKEVERVNIFYNTGEKKIGN